MLYKNVNIWHIGGKQMEKLKVYKKSILVLVDIILINLAYILSLYFRFTKSIPNDQLISYRRNFLIISFIYIMVFYFFKIYDSLWSYASIDEFMLVGGGGLAATVLSVIAGILTGSRLPYSVSILAGILTILFVGIFRISFRVYRRSIIKLNKMHEKPLQRVMIIGAGAAGAMLIKEMKFHKNMNCQPVALIDDNKYKKGTKISGVKIVGDRNDIVRCAKEYAIDVILLAIPSMDLKNKRQIIEICKKTNCKLKTIPGIYEIIDGKVSLNKMRDVDYEDLLGRKAVKLDMNGIEEYIKGRTILITGGGGSIGSELCRQIAKFKPKEVIVLDNYENGVYELQMEFKYNKVDINLTSVIASITDMKRLENVFIQYKPQLVFHAAAHKHVPLMEGNPIESVKNNVFGTLNLVKCADKYNVKKFVMISTDKAVNPTNIMGATKRACEMIVQSMDKRSKTEFASVRFGNVLGSNGSVIPLFKNQIAHGGPVTVTHPEINRFFMTIPEAAQLVLQAGAYAKGGEIFVLDMENPIKIYDLACDLIKLSGYEPNVDIKIEFIGLRPGEKLYEEVLTEEEGLKQTANNKIFVGKSTFEDYDGLVNELSKFKEIVDNDDRVQTIIKMQEIVPTYTPLYGKNINEEVAATKEIIENNICVERN